MENKLNSIGIGKIQTWLKTTGNMLVFAIYQDNIIIEEVKKPIQHRLLTIKKYNVTSEEYDSLIRGYITPYGIVFFKNEKVTRDNCISLTKRFKRNINEISLCTKYLVVSLDRGNIEVLDTYTSIFIK